MPKNISGTDPYHSDGIFPQILVNTFAAQINSQSSNFLVYNTVSTSPLFKIDGSGVSPTATFYCDLNVIGSATFTSVTNIAVTASMISLATGNNVSDLVDIGFYGLYNSSGNKYRGLVKSISLGRWVLFKDITTVPSSTVTLSGSWRDTLEVQDIYFNGDGSTLSALATVVNGISPELKNLTDDEIKQLQNIGTNTISSTQWGYIAASNQRTDTAGTPSFSGLTLSTGVASLPTGTVGAPTLNFSDAASGLYRPASNQIGISCNGSLISYWSTSGLLMNTGTISALAGSVGTPSINVGSSTTGFYQPSSNQIGISVSGSNIGTWSSTGLAINSLEISGVSTLTATTLAGTLSTASQPNVTTLAGVTSLGTSFDPCRINGQVSFNTTPFSANVEYSFAANTSFFELFQINGTLGTTSDTTTMYFINATPNIRTNGADVYGIRFTPFYSLYGASSTAYGLIVQPTFSFNSGATLGTYYGIYADASATGTLTNITGYFNHPSSGSSARIGVFAGSLSVGSPVQVLSSGQSYFGGNMTLASGVLTTPAGTVKTPTLNFSDSTTGFYRPSSNQIGISVSGSNIGTWSSTGLAMNSLAISGVSTLTATNLAGTLSTASQPNVTSLGTLTSLIVNGTGLFGTTSINANALLQCTNTTRAIGFYMTGTNTTTATINSTTSQFGMYADLTHSITASTALVSTITLLPSFAVSAAQTVTLNAAEYIKHQCSGGTGSITTASGLIIAAGASSGTSITNYYGLMVSRPSTGTTCAIATWTENLNVGDNSTTNPPSGGMYCYGSIYTGQSTVATTATSQVIIGNTVATSSKLSLTGAALNSTTSSDGIAMTLTNNSAGNRQLTIGDSALLASSSSNPTIRIMPNSGTIDALATNASTVLPLIIGNTGNTLTLQGSSTTLTNNLRVNGLIGVNIAPVATYYQTINCDNTNYNGLYVGGLATDNTTATKSGIKIDMAYRPTNSNSNYYSGALIQPAFASSSTFTLSGILAGIYLSDFFTSNAGTISTAAGIYYDGGGSLPGGTLTNHYGGYFATPAAGTNKIALYAGNLAVGSSTVPPTSGLYVSGASTMNGAVTFNANPAGNIISATWTPTLSMAVSGGSSGVANTPVSLLATYTRVGGMVTAGINFIFSLASGTATTFVITISNLPIKSGAFASAARIVGSAQTTGNTSINRTAFITTNNSAAEIFITVTYNSTLSSADTPSCQAIFQYEAP